jgi:hypothetical protein
MRRTSLEDYLESFFFEFIQYDSGNTDAKYVARRVIRS